MKDSRLFLHTSNQIETLAEMLSELMSRRNAGADPLQTRSVMVHSPGMGRWLSLQLAALNGICFNIDFPFPRDVVERVLKVLVPEAEEVGRFTQESMLWPLFRHLGNLRGDARFESIDHYLKDGDRLKRLQFADRLAYLYDQYLVYRPDLLLEWEADPEPQDWQAILWKELVAEAAGKMHLARIWERFESGSFSVLELEREKLPKEIYIFGISSLSPLFLRILSAYALFGEIHLFLLQPTELYWGDLRSKREQARLQTEDAEIDRIEEGHPLLASLGRQGRDFLNLLIDRGFQPFVGGERFRHPESDSLLRVLQKDIAQLEQREESDRIWVDSDDRSIEIHSCHGQMREVEVLHDQLLDRFEKDPTLRPRDVLVMIPDIELYAPYIKAVFGTSEDARTKIPFSVVDRRPRTEYHAVNVWFLLLELVDSRFGGREVLSLLETAPMRKRLQLGETDLASLRTWMEATGIRWGIDANHRASYELPEIHETTWKSGVEQWLLGYAMHDSGDHSTSWGKVFPFNEIEGRNLTLLDRYLEALDLLFEAQKKLSKERTLAEWTTVLAEFLERLFGEIEEVAFEVEKLREALDRLGEQVGFEEVDEKLPLEVIRHALGKRVDDTVSGGRFLSGGVTFCALQPMRTIPARVIALLGMDDNAFPRRPQQLGFDRMREKPALGDRSTREDDRFLFLETILSARDSLIISHVGQSSHDLTESPPSVVVTELLDHLDQVCAFPDGATASEFLVKRHRLQSFHPSYFDGSMLFSYSDSSAKASRRLFEGGEPERPFFSSALSEPEENFRTVEMGQLIGFFRNPAQYLLQERLGLRFPDGEAALDESELFMLDSLYSYHLKNDAVRKLIEENEEPQWDRVLALGRAPIGAIGRAFCHGVEVNARGFSKRVRQHLGEGVEGEYRQFEYPFNSFVLRGVNGPFFEDQLVFYRPATVKGRDVVEAWIRYLFGCLQSADGCQAILIAEDKTLRFGPVTEVEVQLGALLELYWKGLQKPLPFFPETAYAWYQTVTGKKPENALKEAIKKFDPNFNYPGERENQYIQLCWGDGPAETILNDDFTEITEEVFQGLVVTEIQ